MSGSSPTDRLFDGFTPSQVPPTAPDGGLELEPAPRELRRAPISICELGPCKRLHVIAAKIDAQEPIDGSKIRIPVLVSRTCYPSPGIEFPLDAPVKECSLWEPLLDHERRVQGKRRELFVDAFKDEHEQYIKSWEDDRDDDR